MVASEGHMTWFSIAKKGQNKETALEVLSCINTHVNTHLKTTCNYRKDSVLPLAGTYHTGKLMLVRKELLVSMGCVWGVGEGTALGAGDTRKA